MLHYEIEDKIINIIETDEDDNEFSIALRIIDDILYYVVDVHVEIHETDDMICVDIEKDTPRQRYAKVIFSNTDDFNLICALLKQSKINLSGFYKDRFYTRKCTIMITKYGYDIYYNEKSEFICNSFAKFIEHKRLATCTYKNGNVKIRTKSLYVKDLIVSVFG